MQTLTEIGNRPGDRRRGRRNAQRLRVSSTLVRLAWALSVFFGGLGIVVYLALWGQPQGATHTPAGRIAEERFARGEITAAELERIRRDLQVAS